MTMETPVTHPKLRPLDVKLVQHQNRRFLHLRDPMALSGKDLLLPLQLAPLLNLCDGTRDLGALRVNLMLVHGMEISADQIEKIFREMDEALLLEGPRFEAARLEALDGYRRAPYRAPALAGPSYPAHPEELDAMLADFCTEFPPDGKPTDSKLNPVAGLLSPHIDFQRGHQVYARTWPKVCVPLQDCELVIILGTDHSGGAGRITPTRQDYATPWGPIPTDVGLAEALIGRLGEDAATAEEVHHVREHSIELAVVWLHYGLRKARGRGRSPKEMPRLLPILCGHMEPFVKGELAPETHSTFRHLVEVVGDVMKSRKTLVVAAGDLAHVGPAFGDPDPWTEVDRARLRTADHESIQAICDGDAGGFFQGLRREGDRRRVCGLTPIYLALRLLGPGVSGELTAYDQCPADQQGGSLVSIAGVIWRSGP